ncbi:MAG: hypothetical protein K2X75_02970 [Burkholderiaceae bacterium]|nr:hypothetical protein [Burkholderiaceae bacterium]
MKDSSKESVQKMLEFSLLISPLKLSRRPGYPTFSDKNPWLATRQPDIQAGVRS